MSESANLSPASSTEAEYQLETTLKCPQCREEISTVQVVRLLRSKVNFTSTLPRRGHVVTCPACHGIISANLGGM
ncbi:MAG TPA: hypothetical protein VFG76_01235 [Candidatus Polarisedimenticolia bacterium]|nr:hypothetical protein [Candidatus Polarisedimenticolia bacterium]